ncbi:MAG: extracellular solute-binding protein [Lachnospiraceae bacterium]|nr:extracellular solute-binding protein [Lachnospiraceae bacterium]
MKMKKLLALVLAGLMTASMVGCGSEDAGASASSGSSSSDSSSSTSTSSAAADSTEATVTGDGKLVVWTLAADLKQFAERYTEKTGVQVETVVIEPAEYPTKVQTAIMGGEKEPDIIVGEPQMLEDFFDNGFFANLDELGAKDYEGQIVDYVWKVGQDASGVQRAISYQITPAGIYYRRDIAQEVFGTDDPDEIGKKFADYPTILETAKALKAKGYRIFASDSEINYFSGDSAWVVDGALNVSEARFDYMDLVVSLYQNDLTAYANQWSTPWFQAMSGDVPILTAEIQNYEDDSVNVWDAESFAEATADLERTTVFAFGLPSWGVLTMRDNVGETSGKWGVCAGPAYGFGGGTYIGISSLSERKDTAWDFVKFCTLNEETADWWIEASQGDTVSLISALDKHKDDENPIYGGEKLYSFWLEQAKGIDYSKVTKYDKVIGDAWGAAIGAIKTGQATKEEALNTFYDTIQSTYPEIQLNR